ncbi:MAG TPA: hypothetical protein VM490_03480 [Armatimonadaceae bacterium]|jgi:hypothetical protein|nr:hypothetical protein [Armatimonadaceae bacterium]
MSITANTTTAGGEQDERVVEEVHCAECGVPMTAIPNWYATVRVKFTCDTCRQKSPRMNAAAPAAEVEANRESAVDTDLEEGLEDEDVEAEDDAVEIELEEEAVEPEE